MSEDVATIAEQGRSRAPSRRRTRGRGLTLAVLLALTLAAGVAARIGTGTASLQDPSHAPASIHAGGVALSARLDRRAVHAAGDGRVRLELVMRGDPLPAADAPRVPTDLVVVLDRSGSMQGNPLTFAKAAIFELLEQLEDHDRFGLVTYATGGTVAIPLERAGADARARFQHTLHAISASGGTRMSRGLDLAHDLVVRARADGRAPRVILISDGHANQGDASLEGLRGRAARAVPGEYVVSAVGVGQGFDETLMSALADAGTGNFYYLPDARQLAGVFADEFAAARERIASALEVRMEPGDGIELLDAAGLPLKRDRDGVRFHPGDLFAGQERRLWLTLRAATGRVGPLDTGRLSLRFVDAEGARRDLRLETLPPLACVAAEDDYYASFDADAYRRASASEGLGALQEKVARFMKDGRRREARAEVESALQEMQREQMRALGYVVQEDVESVRRLRDELAAPAAAAPARQKELLEAGRDARRVGSKRK